jgi:hypothetical protein
MAEGASSYSASRWTPVDIPFTADPGGRLAFDIEFSATFVEESGESLTVPGYWDGENHFVVRFSPPSEGNWSYVTSSSLPTLDELRGSVKAGPALAGQRGPIGIAPDDSRRFVYADGSRYFPLAFEIDWLFALDAENAGGIPSARHSSSM